MLDINGWDIKNHPLKRVVFYVNEYLALLGNILYKYVRRCKIWKLIKRS